MNVKKVLLLCLFLTAILAVPVQGQQAPAQVTNPTELADCGLPATSSQFTSASSITTFELVDDCTYGNLSARPNNAILYITAGTFTINGNGHTIEGPPHTLFATIQGSGTVLNLNNVVIRANGGLPVIRVGKGSTLNGQNIIFRDNFSSTVVHVRGGTATLRDVQFLNNRQVNNTRTAAFVSAITAERDTVSPASGATVTVTNGIFRGNRNDLPDPAPGTYDRSDVILSAGSGTTVTLDGCSTFADNLQSDGTAADDTGTVLLGGGLGTVITTGITGPCPAGGLLASYWLALTPQKKSKKTATPRPSATFRPLATTCIDLNLASGIVVHATYGLDSGVQCQRLGGGGIGFQALADNYIDAVDVWGYVEQGVEVCFPQAGELLFLDARMMPRAIAPLAATVVNGMTCGAIDSPGSIVLMPPP